MARCLISLNLRSARQIPTRRRCLWNLLSPFDALILVLLKEVKFTWLTSPLIWPFYCPHLLEKVIQVLRDGQSIFIGLLDTLDQVLPGGQPIFIAPFSTLDLVNQNL